MSNKPVMMWLSPDELHINEQYQRTISTKRGQTIIRGIAEEFDWALFLPLVVTTRAEGGYWVIDGQHRLAGAKAKPLDEVPVVLMDIKTASDQARAFVGINARRVNMHALAIHHAMVAAGDPLAVGVQNCCDKAGVVIPRYPKMLSVIKPNETMALATLKSTFNICGPDALIWSLRILRAAYADEPGQLSGGYIRGLATFFNAHQDHHVDEKTVIWIVSDYMYSDFLEGEDDGRTVFNAVEGMTARYNTMKPAGKPLLPVSGGK